MPCGTLNHLTSEAAVLGILEKQREEERRAIGCDRQEGPVRNRQALVQAGTYEQEIGKCFVKRPLDAH